MHFRQLCHISSLPIKQGYLIKEPRIGNRNLGKGLFYKVDSSPPMLFAEEDMVRLVKVHLLYIHKSVIVT